MIISKMDPLMRIIRVRIDSAADIGLLIVWLAIYFALLYFIPKFFPDISNRTFKIICIAVAVVLVLIWTAVVGE